LKNNNNNNISIGVLGIQGDIEENIATTRQALTEMQLNGDVSTVTYTEQLERVDGLILPGGESTVVSSLITLQHGGMLRTIKKVIHNGMPAMGICAGMIMLSKRAYDRVVGETKQQFIANLDVVVERNAFGRQNDSFEVDLEIPVIGKELFRSVFIRAPVVTEVGNQVEVLAKFNEKIVAVAQNNIIATAFHPELSGDSRLHMEFIKKILKYKQKKEE
jgi:pyridoxal 5'-phosphate synthase pdxT subunit